MAETVFREKKESPTGISGIEATCMFIKPEVVGDSRLGKLYKEVAKYCNEQEIMIVGMRRIPADEVANNLRNHYLVEEGKFEATGKKVLRAFETQSIPNQERDALLSKFNLSADDPYSIGKWVMELELREYAGKEEIFLLFAGPNAIKSLYEIRGTSDPLDAKPGTLRAKFSSMHIVDMFRGEGKALDNIVHVPESKDEASRYILETFNNTEDEVIEKYNKKLLLRVSR